MDFGGWSVHVESVGGGTAVPPVLLLHGFGSGSFTWEPVVQAGMVADRPAVAFDRIGFGRSDRPPAGARVGEGAAVNPYSLAGAVALSEAVLDHAGWTSPAVLVAHSAGALVALATALASPSRVRALVLIAPAVVGGGPPRGVGALFRLPMVRRWAPPMLRAGRSFVGRSVAMAWHDRGAFRSSGLGEAYEASTSASGWAEGLVELTLATSEADAASVAARLGEVSVPVLVVVGAHDRLVPAASTALVAEQVQDGRLVTIADAGHVPHEERPAEVVAAVRAFLRGLGQPSDV